MTEAASTPAAPAAPAAPMPKIDLGAFGKPTPRNGTPSGPTAERRASLLANAKAAVAHAPAPEAGAPPPAPSLGLARKPGPAPAEGAEPPATEASADDGAAASTAEGTGTGTAAAAEETPLERAKRIARASADDHRRKQARAAQRAREQSENAQARAEAAQLRSSLNQVNGRLQRIQSDPLAALREMGVGADELARRAIQAGTPEEKIALIEQARQRDVAELRQLKQQLAAKEHAELVRAEETRFQKQAGNAKLYPNLTNEHPRAILALAKEIATKGLAQGKSYSNEEILSYLDRQYGKHKTKGLAGSSGHGNGAEAGAKTAKPAARTLSNADQTAMNSKPATLKDLKPADQRAELLRRARADMAAKIATRR